jgi:hypothetical protein
LEIERSRIGVRHLERKENLHSWSDDIMSAGDEDRCKLFTYTEPHRRWHYPRRTLVVCNPHAREITKVGDKEQDSTITNLVERWTMWKLLTSRVSRLMSPHKSARCLSNSSGMTFFPNPVPSRSLQRLSDGPELTTKMTHKNQAATRTGRLKVQACEEMKGLTLCANLATVSRIVPA